MNMQNANGTGKGKQPHESFLKRWAPIVIDYIMAPYGT